MKAMKFAFISHYVIEFSLYYISLKKFDAFVSLYSVNRAKLADRVVKRFLVYQLLKMINLM